MIHRLFRTEPRDRRQHAKRVRGQHDDVARMSGATFGDDVLNAGERIRSACFQSCASSRLIWRVIGS